LSFKPKTKAKDLTFKAKAKAKAKDLTFKAKAKDSKFVLEDISRPRTKAMGNNTDLITPKVQRSTVAYFTAVQHDGGGDDDSDDKTHKIMCSFLFFKPEHNGLANLKRSLGISGSFSELASRRRRRKFILFWGYPPVKTA